jgi:nicotinamidase-related amidase
MDKIPVIDKAKTALVVIDLQKGIASMQTQPHAAKDVIQNAADMAKAFRKNNMPVFLVRVSSGPKERLNPAADVIRPMPAQMPPDWSEIVPELSAGPEDVIITKKQWGAFYGTELDLQLRRRDIKTIVLCGISTVFGVESTARSAYEHGYNQIFAEDAMSAQSTEEHEHAIKKIFPRIGLVRSTKDVLEALG